jgi:hypothetical protein
MEYSLTVLANLTSLFGIFSHHFGQSDEPFWNILALVWLIKRSLLEYSLTVSQLDEPFWNILSLFWLI